jgi:hypothetical protein
VNLRGRHGGRLELVVCDVGGRCIPLGVCRRDSKVGSDLSVLWVEPKKGSKKCARVNCWILTLTHTIGLPKDDGSQLGGAHTGEASSFGLCNTSASQKPPRSARRSKTVEFLKFHRARTRSFGRPMVLTQLGSTPWWVHSPSLG